MTLQWYGDAVYAQVVAAAVAGTEETVDAAVEEAAQHTPVLTGSARDSLRREGGGLSISWGYHVAHGFFLEVGARGKAGIHAMRRAADHQYPRLAQRIREAL